MQKNLILKIIVSIIFLFHFSFARAQNSILEMEIHLSKQTASLGQLLETIQQKSACVFSHSNEIKTKKKVKIQGGTKSIQKHLEEIFEKENVKFIAQDKKIIIVPDETLKRKKYFQQIRGRVIDAYTQQAIIGANIVVKSVDPIIGSVTDNDGNYLITKVPVGRHVVEISCIGYKPQLISGVAVNSAKQKVLNFSLEEQFEEIDEIVVRPDFEKSKPINNMTSVSARSFSVEETRRFAGGADDPSRMVTSFAGVASGGMLDNNAIVVRGNSPKGILWRLEGVEVFNPNHFAGMDYTGAGAVTIFSAQMLDNSDFYTGAFPAEYGNGSSGVFDIKLRNGNANKREYTFQAGVMGLDFATEGPFVKGKKSSYLVNYRYSTFGLLSKILDMNGVPIYQDLSFKTNFPTKKMGTFSLWGMGAYDYLEKLEVENPEEWEISQDRHRENYKLWNGAIGLNHKLNISNKTHLNSSLAMNYASTNITDEFLMDYLYFKMVDYMEQSKGKYTATVNLSHKFGKRHINKTGIIANHLFYNMDIRSVENTLDPIEQYVKEDGNAEFYQAYTQSKFNITDNLFLNVGVHANFFNLNNTLSIEPRFGLRWKLAENHTLGMGYGLHSRLEELNIYLVQRERDGKINFPNKDLELSKSHHFVTSYEWQISKNLFFKIEPYLQELRDVPVTPNGTYSFVNYKSESYFNDSVVNRGEARNIGVDITFERYLHNDFYFMSTISVFDSKYKGDDGVERNTMYNRNFIFNFLGGKEFHVGKNKNNVLGINFRANYAGGNRYIPVNDEQTRQKQEVVYDDNRLYESRWPSKLNFDLTLTYRRNKEKYSSVWALQFLNLFATKNYYGFLYNYSKMAAEEDSQNLLIPILSWKIEF